MHLYSLSKNKWCTVAFWHFFFSNWSQKEIVFGKNGPRKHHRDIRLRKLEHLQWSILSCINHWSPALSLEDQRDIHLSSPSPAWGPPSSLRSSAPGLWKVFLGVRSWVTCASPVPESPGVGGVELGMKSSSRSSRSALGRFRRRSSVMVWIVWSRLSCSSSSQLC